MYLYSETCQSHGFRIMAKEKKVSNASSPITFISSDALMWSGKVCRPNFGEILNFFNARLVLRCHLFEANGIRAFVMLDPAFL